MVSAGLDAGTTARLDGLRRAHFPPERLVVGAHLTLFHALPGEHEDAVLADLADAAAATPPLTGAVDRVLPLGRGVAYGLAVPGLGALRAGLAERWAPWLTRQDAGGFRAHVTVQNKVEPATAKALLAELDAAFEPWPATVEALELWRYAGGPWAPVRTLPLAG